MKKFILTFIISSFVIWPGITHAENILPIGDSLTLGYTPYLQKELPSSNVLTPIAEVGASSRKMLGVVETNLLSIESSNPKYVFILLGTNDAPGLQVNPEITNSNITNIIYALRGTGAKFYVSLLPPLLDVNSIGKINESLLKIEGATIVHQDDITVDMLTDGIHPDATGYQIIACNFLRVSGLKTDCVKPKVTPKANIPAKIPTRGKKCPTGDSLGFAPLRPDPGEPCEETVPEETVFACGSSITPLRQEEFDPYGDGCDRNNDGTVTCYKVEDFGVALDLSKANIGILGNTQDQNLTDEQKVNEYLSWYLSGVPQVGDQKKPDDDKLINFSGPIRKLIPFDLSSLAKKTIAESQPTNIHNYKVGDVDPIGLVRANLSDFSGIFPFNQELFKSLFQNIPYSSLEDTVGEYVVSATDLKKNNLQDASVLSPGDKGFQVPVKLTITSTNKSP